MTADSGRSLTELGLDPAGVSELLNQVMESCSAWNRGDLAALLEAARARVMRPSTLVCVVGEYKQGKSLLINALTGFRVCPVDDDLATTTLTVIRHSEQSEAQVFRSDDGETHYEEISPEQLYRYVTENGEARDRAGIELVEVGVPSSVLENGLTLVDTPGVGGILEQNSKTTLTFLSKADGVIFTTDASQGLTAPERAFLDRVRRVCPYVVVAITKTDLYPEWMRIVEIDRQQLGDLGDMDLIPVSSSLAMEGLIAGDSSLENESGIPKLIDRIRTRIVAPAKDRNVARAVDDMRWALYQLLQPVETQISMLEDPNTAEKHIKRLNAAQQNLTRLQEAGSRWSTVLNDGFNDLRTEVDYKIRTAMRGVLTETDQRLDDIDPASDWESFSREIQEMMNLAVDEIFVVIDNGTAAINKQISDLLLDEDNLVADLKVDDGLDAMAVWDRAERLPTGTTGGSVAGSMTTVLSTIRGASSGMILLGVVGNVAGLAFATPVSLGAAAFFGVKQLLETRRTALKQRRQEARAVIRRYTDEVNLELGNRSRRLIQEAHRTLRDHYAARLQEVSKSTAEALQAAKEVMATEHDERNNRLEQLEKWSTHLHRQLDSLPTKERRESP